MLEAWLTAESALELSEEAVDEPQDHHATSEQAGVHLYSPVDAGSGAPPSREYRASVRVEGQGAGIGLDRDGDPYAGPGSRSVGHADDGTGGLQDAGGGCLDGTGGRSVCPGGVAPGVKRHKVDREIDLKPSHRQIREPRIWKNDYLS